MSSERGLRSRWDTLREILGVQRPIRTLRLTSATPSSLGATHDAGTTDYRFYDRLRSGRAKGYEISGLLAKPLYSKIASWVIGERPTFKVGEDEATSNALNDWWARNHSAVMYAYEDALALGDNYLVVNADLTVTAIPPHVIRPLVDDRDYSVVTGWRIEEVYPHPTDGTRQMTIVDVYTDRQRQRLISVPGRTTQGSVVQNAIRDEVFPVLVGRVPIVHLDNNRGPDEMFGHSESEALTPLLQRYNELIDAAMGGNKRQGRPTPVISNLGSPQEVDAFWKQYSTTKTETLADGTTQTQQTLTFDADKLMTLGGTARFDWVSPSPFTGDTSTLLGLLFYLYIQHSELPEWVLGNAIASSRASAQTQVEPLVKFVQKKRAAAEKWMQNLNALVLAWLSLSDATIKTSEVVEIKWDSLTNEDGTLKLSTLQWLYGEGLIDRETALTEAPIPLDNIPDILDRAEQEREARQAALEDQQDRLIAQADARAQQADRAATPDTA
jgi:hypothetical protein